jgi:RNA polymerase sigma factor (sigma-70 family)
MHDDLSLLQRYARDGEEEAFAELVRRHLNLVFSAALRQVRSPQLAEEVAQSVFTDLARDAGRLKPGTILAAWLYQVTRRTAIDVVRREARRQLREQVASEMNAMNSTPSDWAQVEPLLDDAMAALDDTDRAAVLLRYFENKSLREVGAALGTSDDTAQKRVGRAVDKLREFFATRGVTVGTSGLVVVISANAVQAAPAGLALSISAAAALAGTSIATSAIVTATKTIAMTTLQKTIYAVTLAAGVGVGVYEAQRASRLQRELHALSTLTAKVEQVRNENDITAKRLAATGKMIEQLQRDAADVHRLRGEVTALRQQTNELARLRTDNQRLRESSADAVRRPESPQVDAEELRKQRAVDAKQLILSTIVFARSNQDRLPEDLGSLGPFLKGYGTAPLSDVNQFEFVGRGKMASIANPANTILWREKQARQRGGKWEKFYAFADGHVEIATDPPGGFDAWEKRYLPTTLDEK